MSYADLLGDITHVDDIGISEKQCAIFVFLHVADGVIAIHCDDRIAPHGDMLLLIVAATYPRNSVIGCVVASKPSSEFVW